MVCDASGAARNTTTDSLITSLVAMEDLMRSMQPHGSTDAVQEARERRRELMDRRRREIEPADEYMVNAVISDMESRIDSDRDMIEFARDDLGRNHYSQEVARRTRLVEAIRSRLAQIREDRPHPIDVEDAAQAAREAHQAFLVAQRRVADRLRGTTPRGAAETEQIHQWNVVIDADPGVIAAGEAVDRANTELARVVGRTHPPTRRAELDERRAVEAWAFNATREAGDARRARVATDAVNESMRRGIAEASSMPRPE
jgi:hypothetical protein